MLASIANVLFLAGTLLADVIYPLLWVLLAVNAAHFAFIAYVVRTQGCNPYYRPVS